MSVVEFHINEDFNEFGSLIDLGYEDLGEVQEGVSYLGDLYRKTRDLELYKEFQGKVQESGKPDMCGVWTHDLPEHVTKIREYF